jgi:uncharacterized membrane protein
MYVALTVFFLLLIVLFIFYGWGIVMRRSSRTGEESKVQCSVCRNKYPAGELVSREIGDYKLMYFCGACIKGLSEELGRRGQEKKV